MLGVVPFKGEYQLLSEWSDEHLNDGVVGNPLSIFFFFLSN